MLEQQFAAELFERLTGQVAPDVDGDVWPTWAQWDMRVHEQDGAKPLYETASFFATGRDSRKETSPPNERESLANQKTLDIYLHEGQRRAWDSERRFVFMIAGKQSGKTIFGPVWLLRTIQRLGAGDYLAVSATYDLFKLKLLPALKGLFCDVLKIGRYWAGDRLIEICNPYTGKFAEFSTDAMWARIILRSADSEEGLQSATAKAAWLDEPGLYKATVWKDVRGRLALHRGPALGTTTPYDLGWLKQQIYDRWIAGDSEIDVIQFASKLSPFFSEEEWESLRASMQTWRFLMDYAAEFERPPGAIYPDFSDNLRAEGGHLVERFVIPDDWPRIVAIDPGVINVAKIWAAHDPVRDEYYLYRAEKGGERMTSKEHARYDVDRANTGKERVKVWAIGAKSEVYWRQDYKAAGADGVKEPDTHDVEEGIDRGTLLLKQKRVYVMDDLYELIDEFLRYAREITPEGEVTDKIKDKSTFHLMDAYRYFAVNVVKKKVNRTAKAVSYVG